MRLRDDLTSPALAATASFVGKTLVGLAIGCARDHAPDESEP